MRTEFGQPRTQCACRECQKNCRFIPGFLIPADLGRMIPQGADPYQWAEANLLASPGALVLMRGQPVRIPTLVPATKPDGSCVYLTGGKRNGRCTIHEVAPFGCAFFDCRTGDDNLSASGIFAILSDPEAGLYKTIWRHLDGIGKRSPGPAVLRARMAASADH